eukprot:COSAG06_NODE_158_length_21760_cov_36.036979_2_plen_68_part_00
MQVAELFKIRPTSGLGDLLQLNNSLDGREGTAAAAVERRRELRRLSEKIAMARFCIEEECSCSIETC